MYFCQKYNKKCVIRNNISITSTYTSGLISPWLIFSALSTMSAPSLWSQMCCSALIVGFLSLLICYICFIEAFVSFSAFPRFLSLPIFPCSPSSSNLFHQSLPRLFFFPALSLLATSSRRKQRFGSLSFLRSLMSETPTLTSAYARRYQTASQRLALGLAILSTPPALTFVLP